MATPKKRPEDRLPRGRKPGSVNTITRDVRKVMQAFAEKRSPEELERLWKAMTKANPGRAFELYIRLVEYFVPKLARHEITGPGGEGPAIVERIQYVVGVLPPPAPAANQIVNAEVVDAEFESSAGAADGSGGTRMDALPSEGTAG